jgi:tRNA(fMet)-specific endonuclease VapC
MFLLDTDIRVYVIHQKPARVLERLAETDPCHVAILAVTFAELEDGVSKSRDVESNRHALTLFVAPIEVLAFGVAAARAHGGLRRQLERRGRPIGKMDLRIAAHALAVDAVLVTNNSRESSRIRGLRVQNSAR